MTRFRTLIVLIVAAVLVYTGLWYTAGMRAEKRVVATLSAWRDSGLRVDHGRVSLDGFPYRMIVTIDQPSVATKAGGLVFHADTVTLISHLWTPGHWLAEGRNVEAAAANGAWALTDAYMRASYRTHDDGRPVIVLDSLTSEDFRLEKAPGLKAATGLDGWTLFLRPGAGQAEPANGLYEERFLDFKLTAHAGDQRIALEGGISGPIVRDWTPDALGAWRDAGGLMELTDIELAVPGARVKGNASLTLDENFRPLGSASLNMAGMGALTKWLNEIGIDAADALRAGDDARSAAVMMQAGQLTIGNVDVLALRPVIAD